MRHPTNDEPRELTGGAGSKGQDQYVSLDCAAAERRAQLAGRFFAVLCWAAALALAAAGGWL